MTKKYSSYKEHQLITENWRRYLNEESTLPGGHELTPKVKAVYASSIKSLARHLVRQRVMTDPEARPYFFPDMPDLLNRLIYDAESAETLLQFLGVDTEMAPHVEFYKKDILSAPEPYNAPYYEAGRGYRTKDPLAPAPDEV